MNPLAGLALLKAKRDIGDKIKAINQKLGLADEEDKNFATMSTSNENDRKIPQESVREWRRIEIRDRKIDRLESNFEKEL